MNMIRKATFIFVGATMFTAPLFAFAQGQPQNLTQLIGRFVEILDALIPLLFGIALIGFLWGVGQFILKSDNEEERKKGKQIMIWGIIGLFVMTAVWGLVLIIGGTFGVRFVDRPQTPQLPGGSSGILNTPSRNTTFGTEDFIPGDLRFPTNLPIGPLQ